MRHLTVLGAAILTLCPLRAGDFPAIPAEVWALREDPARGIQDAVVVFHRTRILEHWIEHQIRLRVLTPAGKVAAESWSFGAGTRAFKGQTTARDGRVTPFLEFKDAKLSELRSQGARVARRKLIVPGLDGDCVVDLRWEEPLDRIDPLGGALRWRISSPWFMQERTVEVDSRVPYACTVFQPPTRMARKSSPFRGGTRYEWQDIPAEPPVPFSLSVTRPYAVVVLSNPIRFKTFNTPSQYWGQAASYVLKPLLEPASAGNSEYQAFSKEIRTGLPEGREAAVEAIVLRLRERIRCTALMSPEEVELLKKEDTGALPGVEELNRMVERRWAHPLGMTVLLYNLLKDAAIPARPLLVSNRNATLFRFDQADFSQVADLLLSVETGGAVPLIVDPGLRFNRPGLLRSEYQGITALSYDPVNLWTPKLVKIDVQVGGWNRVEYRGRIRLGGEEDRLELTLKSSGLLAHGEQIRFQALNGEERTRLLKEDLEALIPEFGLTGSKVEPTDKSGEGFRWAAEGRMGAAGDGRRQVAPFPGLRLPLEVPDSWPEGRTEMIVLPHAFVLEAETLLEAPEGRRWVDPVPLQQVNAFGKVERSFETVKGIAGPALKVKLRVQLDLTIGKAGAYPALKDFLGWMQEAVSRPLVLERAAP